MKTSRRPLLDTILNPSGLAATVRNNEVRVQKIERAPVKFTLERVKAPKKSPQAEAAPQAGAATTSVISAIFSFRDPEDLPTDEGYDNRTSFFFTIDGPGPLPETSVEYELYIMLDTSHSNDRRSAVNQDYVLVMEANGNEVYNDTPGYGRSAPYVPDGIWANNGINHNRVVGMDTIAFWEPFSTTEILFFTTAADNKRFNVHQTDFNLDSSNDEGEDFDGRGLGEVRSFSTGHWDTLHRLTKSYYP